MKLRIAGIVGLALATLSFAGCERPPQAEGTIPDPGPPKVAHVDPATPEGKAIAAAKLLPHENFVPVPKAPEAATPTSPAAAPATGTAPATAPAAGTPPATVPATGTPPAATAPAPGALPPVTPPAAGTAPASAAPAAPPAAEKQAPGTQRDTAASEAHRQAQETGSGIVATPLGALRYARNRVANIEIENALKFYVVEKGKPRSTEEFLDKVVKASNLKLPPLAAGEKYVYDPNEGPNGTLLIERPAEQPK